MPKVYSLKVVLHETSFITLVYLRKVSMNVILAGKAMIAALIVGISQHISASLCHQFTTSYFELKKKDLKQTMAVTRTPGKTEDLIGRTIAKHMHSKTLQNSWWSSTNQQHILIKTCMV